MKTRHIALAVALASGLFLSACTSESNDDPAPPPATTTTATTPPTSTTTPPPATLPASENPAVGDGDNKVPATATGNAKDPSKDSGIAACGTFDGKLGPDLPVPNDVNDAQLTQLRKDFGASAYTDVAKYGVAFVDTLKKAKDGDDSATADDLAKSADNLAKACQAHVK